MLQLVFLLTLLVAYGAYRLRSLTFDGFIAAVLLGFGIFLFTGPLGYCLMGVFFVSSSLLSKFSAFFCADLQLDLIHERQDRRDATQVMANGAVPFALGLLYALTQESAFLIGAATGFAAAAADTWASELGVLSPVPPKTLIRRTTVTPGLSGGVTAMGLIASAGGGVCIGISYGVLQWLLNGMVWPAPVLYLEVAAIALAGFFGAFIDSLLGELFQAKYKGSDPQCPITEKPFNEGHQANSLVEGYRFINNNRVNLVSCLLVSLIVSFVFLFF